MKRLKRFRAELPSITMRLGLQRSNLLFADYASMVVSWIRQNPIKAVRRAA